MASARSSEFSFFWKSGSPFSQWHPSRFVGVCPYEAKDAAPQTFFTAEHWMMYNKAVLFGDNEKAQKILKARSPHFAKRLGRQVRGFDAKVWDRHKRSILYRGNYLKFTQNPKLRTSLENTGRRTLVEASPTDRIYGIGLQADDPRAQKRDTWLGQNVLGFVLTQLRDDLKNSKSCVPPLPPTPASAPRPTGIGEQRPRKNTYRYRRPKKALGKGKGKNKKRS